MFRSQQRKLDQGAHRPRKRVFPPLLDLYKLCMLYLDIDIFFRYCLRQVKLTEKIRLKPLNSIIKLIAKMPTCTLYALNSHHLYLKN